MTPRPVAKPAPAPVLKAWAAAVEKRTASKPCRLLLPEERVTVVQNETSSGGQDHVPPPSESRNALRDDNSW